MGDALLDDLDPEQRAAVTDPRTPLAIVAPDAAAAGQAFREPGEPRDVREEQRTVEIEVPTVAR